MTDDQITQIRERLQRIPPYSTVWEAHYGSGAAPKDIKYLLALVDQLRQERDAAKERVRWFEKSGGVAAHTRVFQEMNRAEAAEEACARLRTALEEALPKLRYAYRDLIGPDDEWSRGRRCRFADALIGPYIVKFEAALSLPSEGSRQREEQKER